jgi:hypothetical protein
MKKVKIRVTEEEKRCIIIALTEYRNRLIAEGKYTDVVDETLLDVIGG